MSGCITRVEPGRAAKSVSVGPWAWLRGYFCILVDRLGGPARAGNQRISSFWVPLFVGQSDFRPLVANKFAWTVAGQPTKQPQSEPKNPSAAAAAMEEAWPPLAPAPEAAAPPGGGGGGGAWGAAAVAQRKEVAEESSAHAVSRLVASCANTSGVAVAVVDANAVISGGAALSSSAARLVTVPEVLEEVRDASARRRLALLMAPVETLDPAPEFVKKGRYYLQQF